MDIKKNLNQLTDKTKGVAIEVQHGMQTIWLARSIKQDLDNGTTLEAAISSRLPALDAALLQEDTAQLERGIQSLRESTGHAVNVEWVRQQLTDALCDLDTEKRVMYLHNQIEAISTAYPACAPSDREAAELARIAQAESHTDDDVHTMLDILSPLLPRLGELLQRGTVKAMLRRADKVDHAKVAQKIDSGEHAVAAYAAACYIMQKRGAQIKLDGNTDMNLSAFTIGASAAASVESSKVVEMYQAGKLTLEAAASEVGQFFTAAVTYACQSMLHAMALGLYVATTWGIAYWIVNLFAALGAFLYFSPVMLCVAATLLAVGVTSLTISIKDCEDLIRLAWDLLREVWDKITSVWHRITARAEDENTAGTRAEEAEDKVENENEVENEDVDEDVDEDESVDEGAFA